MPICKRSITAPLIRVAVNVEQDHTRGSAAREAGMEEEALPRPGGTAGACGGQGIVRLREVCKDPASRPPALCPSLLPFFILLSLIFLLSLHVDTACMQCLCWALAEDLGVRVRVSGWQRKREGPGW